MIKLQGKQTVVAAKEIDQISDPVQKEQMRLNFCHWKNWSKPDILSGMDKEKRSKFFMAASCKRSLTPEEEDVLADQALWEGAKRNKDCLEALRGAQRIFFSSRKLPLDAS